MSGGVSGRTGEGGTPYEKGEAVVVISEKREM